MSEQRQIDRRTFVGTTAGAGLIGVAGCLGGGPEGDATNTTSAGGTPEGDTPDSETEPTDATEGTDDGEATNVGMVYALGGLGDESFNDAAQRGVQQAAEEYNVEFDESQPQSAEEFSQFQRQYAQSSDPDYDLVSCIGFAQQSALQEVSGQFSDQEFMLVDAVVESDNVANYLFREQEGSFQVGHLAGLLTTRSFDAGAGETSSDSTSVGFVGGVDAPLIRAFQAGYEAGVGYADDDIDVQVNYTGSFSDAQAGREAALSMYESGSDVVFHAAGATGQGVFQAAQETGRYAIGVDSDQSLTQPSYADVILASMVKRVDTAVFEAVESTAQGGFSGGSTVTLGLAEDGVGTVYGDQLGDAIPQEIKDALSESRQAIIDGEVDVPTEP